MTRRHLAAAVLLVAGVAVGCAVPGTPTPTSDPSLVAARRAAGIADCPASTDAPAVPDGMPELSLPCLGGDSSVRLAGLRGPLLVNLWAQWCAPCRAEAPFLADFAAASAGEVAVLGINYNDPQPGLAVEFAQLAQWRYPHLADPERVSGGPLGVPGIPMSLLVAADGRIVARHAGPFRSTAELTAWVQKGLAA